MPDEEFIAIVRERVAQQVIGRSGSTSTAIPTALGPEAWDDPLLWEMLSREQVRSSRARDQDA